MITEGKAVVMESKVAAVEGEVRLIARGRELMGVVEGISLEKVEVRWIR